MSFVDLIKSFATLPDGTTSTIEVRRQEPGHYDADGNWIPGQEIVRTEIASIQNVSGQDLQVTPEGEREKESLKIFTAFALSTGDPKAQIPADFVSYKGNTYRIVTVKTYPTIGVYSATMVRDQVSSIVL